MNAEAKLVTVRVASLEGHTDFSLTPKDALAKVREVHNKEGKWAYVGTSVVAPSRLTEEMLAEAKVVRMLNAVIGGDGMIVDLHIAPFESQDGTSLVEAISPDSKFVVTMEYIPADPSKLRVEPGLRVWVNQEFITEVAHLRTVIFKGGLEKLEEFLQKELSNFKTTYNV